MTQHYDMVVVGGRVSATVTAALLTKRGFRTLLVDQGELASQDAHLLHDLVPSGAGSLVMQRVHDELGIHLETDKRLTAVAPGLQVIFRDQRIELNASRPGLIAEFSRGRAKPLGGTEEVLLGLDNEAETLGEFLAAAKELPANGFFQKRNAAQLMRRYAALGETLASHDPLKAAPKELRAALLALLPFATHLDAVQADTVTVARLVRPVQRWLQGLRQIDIEGGLRGLFLEVARRRAFDEHLGAVAKLAPGSKQVTIELVQSRQEITADVLIDASTDLSGIETIATKLQKKELALTLQAAKPKGHLHVMGIEIDEQVLSPGMGRYMLLLNGRVDEARQQEDPNAMADRPILVTRRDADAPGRQELVLAHPVSAVRAHAEGLDQLESAMQARLERLVPFLADGHPTVHTLFGRGATRDHRPVLAHPLYDPDLDPQFGLTGVSMRTPYKNIFLAGPAVVPGLGIEGEYWSALQAADAAVVAKTGSKPKKHLLA